MEDPGSISGSFPGKGNGYPLQCSCLENSMDRGAWQATKSWPTGRKELASSKQRTLTSPTFHNE